MNASTQAALDPTPLDPVYGLRGDLAETLTPANAYERMLLTAVAQAWFRFQQAQQLERRVFEKTDPLELISNNLETFKAVTGHVTNCERAWRRAIEELKRAQRTRAKATLASPNARRPDGHAVPPPPPPMPQSEPPSPAVASRHPQRE